MIRVVGGGREEWKQLLKFSLGWWERRVEVVAKVCYRVCNKGSWWWQRKVEVFAKVWFRVCNKDSGNKK